MAMVSDLFDVRYGHSLELNRLEQCSPAEGVPFISRKSGDNGIAAYVKQVLGIEPAQPGQLTCALSGNGVLSTFIQERPFYTAFHVACLAPKAHLSKAELLYYCMCIKANRYRFNYGRQANRTLKDIQVPSQEEIPEWAHTVDLDCFVNADAVKSLSKIELRSVDNWGSYQIKELFNIKKGKRLTKANMAPGITPFIGAIDKNNGLRNFISKPAIHEGNTITVNYNGSVAETFYQPEPFWCSDDVSVLYPKFKMNPAIAMFISTVIRLERYRFNYGRKWNLVRMKTAIILLPAKPDGTPDWRYMEQYILSLPFSNQLMLQKR